MHTNWVWSPNHRFRSCIRPYKMTPDQVEGRFVLDRGSLIEVVSILLTGDPIITDLPKVLDSEPGSHIAAGGELRRMAMDLQRLADQVEQGEEGVPGGSSDTTPPTQSDGTGLVLKPKWARAWNPGTVQMGFADGAVKVFRLDDLVVDGTQISVGQ